MRVDRLASCGNIVPGFQTLSILSPLPTHLTGLLIPLKKLFYSHYSLILVSIQCNEGLENKLTRAPLLGLVKYIFKLANTVKVHKLHHLSQLAEEPKMVKLALINQLHKLQNLV